MYDVNINHGQVIVTVLMLWVQEEVFAVSDLVFLGFNPLD